MQDNIQKKTHAPARWRCLGREGGGCPGPLGLEGVWGHWRWGRASQLWGTAQEHTFMSTTFCYHALRCFILIWGRGNNNFSLGLGLGWNLHKSEVKRLAGRLSDLNMLNKWKASKIRTDRNWGQNCSVNGPVWWNDNQRKLTLAWGVSF